MLFKKIVFGGLFISCTAFASTDGAYTLISSTCLGMDGSVSNQDLTNQSLVLNLSGANFSAAVTNSGVAATSSGTFSIINGMMSLVGSGSTSQAGYAVFSSDSLNLTKAGGCSNNGTLIYTFSKPVAPVVVSSGGSCQKKDDDDKDHDHDKDHDKDKKKDK